MKILYPVAFKVDVSASKDDPQKLVLPGIVYTNATDEEMLSQNLTGCVIQLGWWHWSINLYMAFLKC